MVAMPSKHPEYCPEPLAALQDRLALALQGNYYVTSPPTELARHCFDWLNGLRLIVSFDDVYLNGTPRLHVSAGVSAGSRLDQDLAGLHMVAAIQRLHDEGRRSFEELVGVSIPLKLMIVTPKAVHFVGPDRQEVERLLHPKSATQNPQSAGGA